MNMDMIKSTYENAKTFANAKSMVKRINNLLEITPTGYIHPHLYVDNFETLSARLFTAGIAKTKKEIVYTLNQLASIVKRFDISKTHDLRDKIDAFNYGDFKLPDIDVTENTARPWEEMLELFNYEIEHNPNRNAKLACVIFKHGYVLNIKEMYATSTKLGRPIIAQNFLDLDKLTWTLNDHKNDSCTGPRKFAVTQEFVDEARKYIEMRDYLLFYKSNFDMYGTSLLSSIGISAFTNTEIRDSYMHFIWSNFTKEDAMRISENVIGYLPVAVKKFAVKYAEVGRCDLQGCDAHPLHIEDPDKYSVNGKIKIVAVRRVV
jgi:hypothetical protein